MISGKWSTIYQILPDHWRVPLNYFTYFYFSCWKWSHIEVPCDFFHSNALFCCVFFVHFDHLAFESYFSCPRAVLSSRSLLVRCSLHAELISTTYIFNSNCFISIHRLRMLKVKRKTELFPVTLRYWNIGSIFRISGC